MALALIATFQLEGHKAVVYRDVEWNEYRVKFYIEETKHLKNADYHTDDKQDAISTAKSYCTTQQ